MSVCGQVPLYSFVYQFQLFGQTFFRPHFSFLSFFFSLRVSLPRQGNEKKIIKTKLMFYSVAWLQRQHKNQFDGLDVHRSTKRNATRSCNWVATVENCRSYLVKGKRSGHRRTSTVKKNGKNINWNALKKRCDHFCCRRTKRSNSIKFLARSSDWTFFIWFSKRISYILMKLWILGEHGMRLRQPQRAKTHSKKVIALSVYFSSSDLGFSIYSFCSTTAKKHAKLRATKLF